MKILTNLNIEADSSYYTVVALISAAVLPDIAMGLINAYKWITADKEQDEK